MGFADGTPEFKRGRLRATDLAALADAASDKERHVQTGGPLKFDRASGGAVPSYVQPRPILAAIVSGSNPYAWQQKVRTSGTTTVNGPMSGTTSTDPAYEENGNASVPATKLVRMRRDPTTGLWIFNFCY